MSGAGPISWRACLLREWQAAWASRSSSRIGAAPAGRSRWGRAARAPPAGIPWSSSPTACGPRPFLRKAALHPGEGSRPGPVVDRVPNLLVAHPSLPARTVPELIALARARPGQLNWAAGSNGSAPHIAGELFRSMARIDVVRIAYKGTGKALIDLVGGQVQYMFPNAAAVTPHVKSGRLKALAVTGAERSA